MIMISSGRPIPMMQMMQMSDRTPNVSITSLCPKGPKCCRSAELGACRTVRYRCSEASAIPRQDCQHQHSGDDDDPNNNHNSSSCKQQQGRKSRTLKDRERERRSKAAKRRPNLLSEAGAFQRGPDRHFLSSDEHVA